MKALTIDNPYQQQRLKQIIPQTDQRIEQLRQGIDLALANRQNEAAEIARQEAGRDAMGHIRSLASEMRAEEERLFAARTTSADASQSLSASITSIGSGLVVVFAGLSIFLVRRSSRARDVAEAQLRDNNLNLESIVEERTGDLREANEEIQRFAYIVSHDLRSPLVNIMGFTSELEELRGDLFKRIADLEPARRPPASGDGRFSGRHRTGSRRTGQAIVTGLHRGARVHQVVDRQDGSADQRDPQPHPRGPARISSRLRSTMRDLIESIASTVAHQAAEANAQIRVEPLPDIVSDRIAIEQIFSNLIDNALEIPQIQCSR